MDAGAWCTGLSGSGWNSERERGSDREREGDPSLGGGFRCSDVRDWGQGVKGKGISGLARYHWGDSRSVSWRRRGCCVDAGKGGTGVPRS